MAIFRFEAKIVQRSAGRSATAAAAYRAAAVLTDERTGLAFNYIRKRGVLHTEILTPANAPRWMQDRGRLWNAVELAEKRKDAQLARDLVLALPHELTDGERLELVRDFVRETFVAEGMIADVAIHAPDHRGDDRNHHAHVLLTMRTLMGQGFGPKVRDWNDRELLEGWRAAWAVAVNRRLEQAGHPARVDHRSLAEQGLDREPEPKQGATATSIEREGQVSYAGEDRRSVKERNRRRDALADELQKIIAALENEDADTASTSITAAAQSVPRPAWRRYLFELWGTVARAVTRPIARMALVTGKHLVRRLRNG
jgi:ATP-dependent exoDNAse (exonuclease V) alpha subunit